MSGPVALPPELLLDDPQHPVHRAAGRRIDTLGPILGGRRVPGRVQFGGAAGVDATLGTVHVLEVDIDPARPGIETRADGRPNVGPDRLGKLIAVLDVVVGLEREGHNRSLGDDRIRVRGRAEVMPAPLPRAGRLPRVDDRAT
ncbi:MAG TPA: hypothetical protein VH092_18555 [Urbifossiella sp.]|nr:hypothetical protein [Urbifossiella sp.]